MKLILPHRGPLAGISIVIDAMKELPSDLRRFGDQVVLGDAPASDVQVHEVRDLLTDDGWALTLVRSDRLEPSGWLQAQTATRRPAVRRMHAIYRFLQFGAVAVASGDPAQMDAHTDELSEFFKQGRPDFRTAEAISISQFYEPLPER